MFVNKFCGKIHTKREPGTDKFYYKNVATKLYTTVPVISCNVTVNEIEAKRHASVL